MKNSKDVTSMRSALDWLKEEKEVLTVKGEVDPVLEIAAIQKELDDGPALLFENIKGYPGVRNVANVFSKRERIARLFDVEDFRKLKFKCLDAMRHPLAPKVVTDGPCQEVVITKDIDAISLFPMTQHSEGDAGRMLSGGMILITGSYCHGGSELGFKRMNFRGKDWASLAANLHSHAGMIRYVEHRDEEIPMTVNICPSPATMLVGAGFFARPIVPCGADELGFAGGLQGSPIEIVKAKTVDAYAIASSEWVIEGYWLPERAWETDEAERIGKPDVAPFFPEWSGYMGRARKVFKFQVTAITHRKDRPIFFSPLAHSFEPDYMVLPFREASFYELAQRIVPGLVVDVTTPFFLKRIGGLVFQVKKRRPMDEGFQKTILLNALGASPGIPWVMVVDDDVNIYSTDELFWAITTRTNPRTDFFHGPEGSSGGGMTPSEMETGIFHGGTCIDATVPFKGKEKYERAHYGVDKIDLKKWFTEKEIKAVRGMQSEYAKVLARVGG